jgi:hypothetical protein
MPDANTTSYFRLVADSGAVIIAFPQGVGIESVAQVHLAGWYDARNAPDLAVMVDEDVIDVLNSADFSIGLDDWDERLSQFLNSAH